MNNEISVKTLWDILIKSWVWIFLSVIIFSVIGIGVTALITPMYESTAEFYVVNIPEDEKYTSSSVVQATLTLAEGYKEIIASERILGKVSEELAKEGINYSTLQLEEMLTIKNISKTPVLTVNIKNSDPSMAYKIIGLIEKHTPLEIANIDKREDCITVITHGKMPTEPCSPSLLKNVIIAMAMGFVICYAICFIRVVFDTKIHTEEELKNNYPYPVIGIIPTWESREGKV